VDNSTICQGAFTIFDRYNTNGLRMNRIKEVLKEKGISQSWLAKKLDKSYNTINEYARNVRQPSIEDLYRIAKILGVNAKDLLKEA
jgi:putative transcriptional regulator